MRGLILAIVVLILLFASGCPSNAEECARDCERFAQEMTEQFQRRYREVGEVTCGYTYHPNSIGGSEECWCFCRQPTLPPRFKERVW